MPRIVRPMFKDADGLPLVGSHKRCLLGVRPSGPNADVDLKPHGDVNGFVIRNNKGLSVVDDWRHLPGHLIPEQESSNQRRRATYSNLNLAPLR